MSGCELVSTTPDSLAALRPAAFVFDLDGTLTDNMGLHAEAFSVFAGRHGLPPLTREDRIRLDGKRNSEIFPVIFGRPLSETEWRGFEDEKEGVYRQISVGRLRALAGLPRLLSAADRHGLAVGIATSAPLENVTHTLAELGLSKLLPRVVRGDQVRRGKPAPDVFLAAAAHLGVAPGECLAFEDAPAGIVAARSAGMPCVAVATSFGEHELMGTSPPPNAVVANFDEFLDRDGRWLTE